jgi:hypothetical protein
VFFINKGLQAPKLSIEYIQDEFATNTNVFSKVTLGRIRAEKGIFAHLRTPIPGYAYQPGDTRWMDGAGCTKETARKISEHAQVHMAQDLSILETYDFDQAQLNTWDWHTGIYLASVQQGYNVTSADSADEVRQAFFSLQNLLSSVRLRIQRDFDTYAAMDEEAQTFLSSPTKRSGGVKLRVGILNSGDTDAVVYANRATLGFDESNIVITGEKFEVVKAHSFTEAVFYTDSPASIGREYDKWKDYVINGRQEPFSVMIQSSHKPLKKESRLSVPEP